MGDNTLLNPGSGGDLIRTELIGGAKYQVVKIALGTVDNFEDDVSTFNPMPVVVENNVILLNGVVSTNNSSSTPLGSNAVFTGLADELILYSSVDVFVFADQASATNGLQLEFSTDNTNWDSVTQFTIAASTVYNFQLAPIARYFRIIYTNGSVAQGVFRLQTVLRQIPLIPVGEAGQPAQGVLSVQGIPSMTPLATEFTPTAAQLTPAVINAASSGNNTLVAGTASETVKVYRILITFANTVTATLQDGASTALTGAMSFGPNGGFVLDFQSEPWFTTSSGNAFVLNLSAAVQASGVIYYIKS